MSVWEGLCRVVIPLVSWVALPLAVMGIVEVVGGWIARRHVQKKGKIEQ